jgi:hypothetical protein
MAVEFSWKVGALVVQPNVGDLANVVSCVDFTLIGTDGTFGSSTYGSVFLDVPDGDFTPYDGLTEEQVIGWVQSTLGETVISDLKAIVAQRIEELKVPTPTAPLPWG